MPDEYPAEWGFQPDADESPVIDGRPAAGLHSGVPVEPEQRGDEYPAEWRL